MTGVMLLIFYLFTHFIKTGFYIDITLMFYANVLVALSLLIEGYYTLNNKMF